MAKANKGDLKVDRRMQVERREATDRRQQGAPAAAGEKRTSERRKVPRRRQIDPTTCERDYTGDEIEFMQALDIYKRNSGRMFPTCSEILEVIRALGYIKVSPPPAMAVPMVADIPTTLPEEMSAPV